MIVGTGELLENLLSLYENLEDEAANSYVLSFLLLRVGCQAKSYDFEDYREMSREEREKLIKDVSDHEERDDLGISFFLSRLGRIGRERKC